MGLVKKMNILRENLQVFVEKEEEKILFYLTYVFVFRFILSNTTQNVKAKWYYKKNYEAHIFKIY